MFFVHYDALTSKDHFKDTQGLSPTIGQNKCMEGFLQMSGLMALRLLASLSCFNFVFIIICAHSSYSLLWGKNNPHRCSAPRFFSPTTLLVQGNSWACSNFYNTQFNFPFIFPKLFSLGCLWHVGSTRFNSRGFLWVRYWGRLEAKQPSFLEAAFIF